MKQQIDDWRVDDINAVGTVTGERGRGRKEERESELYTC